MSEVVAMNVDSSTVALLNKSEIDQQIATAHKYPRSMKRFREETLQLVTLTEAVAEECMYSLPRDGKTIEGPSARFAEIVASAWGNSRAGARVVNEGNEFVTAQGVFHDLERNVAITYEVQRRITTSKGKRYGADMISTTANAACSIALRNAILKGVPKALWSEMYEAARRTAIGDNQTLANRRARALSVLQRYGVTREQVFEFLGIGGEEDITLDHLSVLFGITTALKEGETTAEQAFAAPLAGDPPPVQQPQARSKKANAPDQAKQAGGAKSEPPSAEREQKQAAPEPQSTSEHEPRAPRADQEKFEDEPRTPISDSMLEVLKGKMEQNAIGETDLHKKFGFDLDGVTTANYNAVIEFIENPFGD